MIKWNKATIEDYELAGKIARRAAKELGKNIDYKTIVMDVVAAHISGCRLKLKDLLKADRFNFLHDICGINENLDRETGDLLNCFLPRYAV